jgi:A/G-specific adenine glycosylase
LFSLADDVIRWQKHDGRHGLPWQGTRDAYRIWLSEIMLQQTQVSTVIPYYRRFLERFPDVMALANAPQQEVMELWSGLGYYSRARNLHRCAQQIVAEHDGAFPRDPAALTQLPGIGRSTSAAIAAFAWGVRAAIMDGNVVRLFARVFGVEGDPASKPVRDELWQLAEASLPESEIEAYTQGLMDLGATICTRTRPKCLLCPLNARCVAFASGRAEQLPGKKAKRETPQRAVVMLAITHAGHVLLEQRPQHGIWGGLLSLPELPAEEGDATPNSARMLQAAAPFGEVASIRSLAPFVHTFSHFRLHVLPYRAELSQAVPMVMLADHVWWDMERIAQAPLPAPVKKLLLQTAGNSEA